MLGRSAISAVAIASGAPLYHNTGVFTFVGNPASILAHRLLLPAQGHFGLAGQVIRFSRVLRNQTGPFFFTGYAVELFPSGQARLRPTVSLQRYETTVTFLSDD